MGNYPRKLSETDVLRKTYEHHGRDTQIVQTLEELGELTVALAKFLNNRGDKDAVIDEIVDVSIMLDQLRLFLFDAKEVTAHRHKKVTRLAKRLPRPEATQTGEAT